MVRAEAISTRWHRNGRRPDTDRAKADAATLEIDQARPLRSPAIKAKVTERAFAPMTKKDKPSVEQPADVKPSREDEARQVVQGYADDQREIIKKPRKPTN
jgi:hypothetical protein